MPVRCALPRGKGSAGIHFPSVPCRRGHGCSRSSVRAVGRMWSRLPVKNGDSGLRTLCRRKIFKKNEILSLHFFRAGIYLETSNVRYASVAQLVEHHVANVIVAGSIPVTRSIFSHRSFRCECSSVGRASRCQRDCRRFDSGHSLHFFSSFVQVRV